MNREQKSSFAGPLADKPAEIDESCSLGRGALPNRRAFFATLLKESVTAACTLHVVNASCSSLLRRFFGAPKADNPRPSGYPFTDEWLEIKPGMGFRNLGVQHTADQFLKHREVVLAAIEKHDVVLLEGCRGQTYFDFVAGLAHHRGKKVVRLESDISGIGGLALVVSPPAAVVASASNGMHYRARIFGHLRGNVTAEHSEHSEPLDVDRVLDEAIADEMEEGDGLREVRGTFEAPTTTQAEEPTWRRALLSLWASGAAEVFGIVRSADNLERNPTSFYHTDWSYTLDGRTVLMLGEIEKFIKDNRGVSAVCITGDLHARGFSAYMSTPESREVFRRKCSVYSRVYKPFLGGAAEVERDPIEG